MSLWGIRPDFSGLSPCYRQIAYVLLTRAPVAARSIATSALPLDLHVLGLSLAFILSHDQTLRCISSFFFLYLQSDSRPKLTSFFLLYYTCFFSVLSMIFISPAFPRSCRPLSSGESDAKVHPFSFPFQIFEQLFFKKFFRKTVQFIQLFYLLIVIPTALRFDFFLHESPVQKNWRGFHSISSTNQPDNYSNLKRRRRMPSL